MTAPAPERTDAPLLERLLPLALLVPPFALVWPLPRWIPDTDPLPHVTGTALVLLAALPLVLTLWISGVRPRLSRAAWFALAPAVVLLLAAFGVLGSTDTFERDRLLLLAATWVPAALGGAALDRNGRRIFVRGLAGLCVLTLAPALIQFASSSDRGGLAGPLGNSGPTAQLALPGAIAGAWLGVARRGLARALGFAAFALAVAHALLAPVVTSVVALVAALVASVLFGAWPREVRTLRSALSAMAAGVLFLGIASLSDRQPNADVVHAAEASFALTSDSEGRSGPDTAEGKPRWSQVFGGLPVRFGVWGATARLAADRGLAGVGPGQFAASFPPYRERAELDASRLVREGSELSEVDHAHNDWLQALCDFGPIGGASWVALSLAIALGALRALKQKEVALAAAGAATLGLWTAAAAHGPLLVHPGSSFVAATLGGMLLARPPAGARPGRSVGAWVAALLMLALVPRALGLHGHGRALADVTQARATLVQPALSTSALIGNLERRDAGLARGLAARPDSPLLLSLTARALGDRAASPIEAIREGAAPLCEQLVLSLDLPPGADLDGARSLLWQQFRSIRPHSVEGLLQVGVLAARSGRAAEAKGAFQEALDLDPNNAALRFNAVRAELEFGDPARAEQLLRDQDHLRNAEARRSLALEAQLGGWLAPEVVLSMVADLRGQIDPLPEHADAWAESEPDPALAGALRSLAYHLWARDHAARGDFETALRTYRQAERYSRAGDRLGSPLIAVERAASERLAIGQPPSAPEDFARTALLPEFAALPAVGGSPRD